MTTMLRPDQREKLRQQAEQLGRGKLAIAAQLLARAAGLDPREQDRQRYWKRPDLWAQECITWPEGEGLTDYQAQALRDLAEHGRLAAVGPRGLGKTALAALAVLWFADTRDGACDWKCGTTAGSWRQLTRFTWPEIRKWARRLRPDRCVQRRRWSTVHELLTLTLKGRTGDAFAAASDDPETLEGLHADEVLYVFDEAKIIPAKVWDSVEGSFSGAGEDTRANAYVLAASIPGEPTGRLYEIFARQKGTESWRTVRVKLEQALAAGRMSKTWVEERRRQWGEDSAVYRNHVLGEFATADDVGIIPLSWVEAAVERWQQLEERGLLPEAVDRVGVDVAWTGEDKTVLALCAGDVVRELREYTKADTMATAGFVAAVLSKHERSRAIVDSIGVGAGVYSRLAEQKYRVEGFVASAASRVRDRSGEFGFTNLRSAAWWGLRERLDPAFGAMLALPPDDRLVGDLTAPHWRMTSGGNVQVESKDDIRKRLGRSTDHGDAVVMAYAQGSAESWLSYLEHSTLDCPRCQGPVLDTEEPELRCGGCQTVVRRCPSCEYPYDAAHAGEPCTFCDEETLP